MKSQTYVILAIILIIIVAVFAVINVEVVEVNYLFWSGDAPLILIILFSVLMGGIITATAGSVKLYRLQRDVKHLAKENKQLDEQIRELILVEEVENEVDETDLDHL